MKSRLLRLLRNLGNTFFPRYCCVCDRRLLTGEEFLCVACLNHLPLTGLKGRKGNIVERLLWDDAICTERANSFLFYRQKSKYSRIYFHFKYFKHPEVAVYFGRLMALDLLDTDFFHGVDCLVPVPLSPSRLRSRGYNQSERLAHGISLVTGLPVETEAATRLVDNPTQTQLAEHERRSNVEDVFGLIHPELLRGKHLLIVDDIITTGSTTRAFAHALLQAGGVKLSVISLATSNRNRRYKFPGHDRP